MVAEEQKRELLEFAVQMARRVGAIHLEWFRRSDLEIGTKSNEFDVVTRADRESEACIVRMVAERYPSHALLGEEGGRRGDVAGDWLWVVDPLDGTTNYSQGLPVFAVSIGLRFRGEPVVGVVYAPWLDELFTAVRSGGAFRSCRGGVPQQIRVGGKQRLGEAVVATGFPYDKDRDPDNNTDNVVRILPHVRGLRRFGAAAYDLCSVAAGTMDGYWELALHEWDVCAGELIVQEAGGVVQALRQDRGVSIVAGNAAIVAAIREYVR